MTDHIRETNGPTVSIQNQKPCTPQQDSEERAGREVGFGSITWPCREDLSRTVRLAVDVMSERPESCRSIFSRPCRLAAKSTPQSTQVLPIFGPWGKAKARNGDEFGAVCEDQSTTDARTIGRPNCGTDWHVLDSTRWQQIVLAADRVD